MKRKDNYKREKIFPKLNSKLENLNFENKRIQKRSLGEINNSEGEVDQCDKEGKIKD